MNNYSYIISSNISSISYYLNYLIYLIFFLSILLFLLNIKNHPISIIVIILIYRSLICINLSLWKINYILSIFLFLIIIRGLLIIFLYFSRLISNEQSKIKPNILLIFIFIIYLINIISLFYLSTSSSNSTFYSSHSSNLLIYKYKFNEIFSTYQSNKFTFNNILNLYEYPINNITILSIFYLLFSLFIIIKICSSKFISIRKIK